MADEPIVVVPESATSTPVQATPVESGTQPTPEVVSVPLADWLRLQDDVATIKQLNKAAQSDKDKQKAKINKSFARKIAAVDEMKGEEGWDEREVRQRKKAYADEAAMQTLELEGLAEEPTPDPVNAISPQASGVNTPAEQKQAFVKALARLSKIAGVPLTEQDVDLSPFLNRRVTTLAEAEALDDAFDAAVQKAIKAKQVSIAAASKELLETQEAQAVADDIEQFGNLGGTTNAGAPGDSGRRNSKDLNADIGAAYRKKYGTPQPR